MLFQDIVFFKTLLTIYLVSIWAKNISSITYIQLLNSNGIMFYLFYSKWQNIQTIWWNYASVMQHWHPQSSYGGSLISFDLHNISNIAKKNQHYKTSDPYHSQKLPTYFCITIYPSPPINMQYWTLSSGGSSKCHHMGQSLWSTNENQLNFCWPFWKTLYHMHMYQSKLTFMLCKA
jgi:hypothetical protein